MRSRMLVVAAGLAAFATPALADFYIVQDSGTKRCSIVEQRPTTQTSVIVGDGKVYTSRTEAEGALRTVKVCESGGTVSWPGAPLKRVNPLPAMSYTSAEESFTRSAGTLASVMPEAPPTHSVTSSPVRCVIVR